MGATTFTDEHTSAVAPSRIFKASIVDSHNLIPNLVPQAIKSIEFVQGNGGAGSIKKINFAEGGGFGSVKYHIDELNEETLTYKYSLLEGDALIAGLEKITYEVKFESGTEGGGFGSVKYHIDELNEETLTYKYSLLEGDALIAGLEKITYEVKFESLPDGGSISKVTSKYYTKDDFKLKEEDVKAGKERVLGMYKVVEDYLLQNPHAYA